MGTPRGDPQRGSQQGMQDEPQPGSFGWQERLFDDHLTKIQAGEALPCDASWS